MKDQLRFLLIFAISLVYQGLQAGDGSRQPNSLIPREDDISEGMFKRDDAGRFSREFHVARNGSDSNTGTVDKPYLTIQMAANMAQPGDVITVHEGVYRERVDPPRGGISDERRIVYQAVPGEKVEIKGIIDASRFHSLLYYIYSGEPPLEENLQKNALNYTCNY